jgi:hypothetical protein
MRTPLWLLFAAGAAAASACSGGGNTSGFGSSNGGGDDGGGGAGDGGGTGPCLTCSLDGSLGPVGEAGGPPPGKTLLYAHDGTTLYQVDPSDPTLSITALGKFDCIGGSNAASSMTDIALDQAATLYGVATDTVFLKMSVAPGGVSCKTGAVTLGGGSLGSRARFYGQSFAPKGVLGASEALLVGNNQGEMYQVDTASGALTIVGTFGTVPANDGNGNTYPSDSNGGAPGTAFQMSGDIVFLANGGSPVGFATVRDCQGTSTCSGVDTLVELDVSKLKAGNNGSVVKAVRGQVVKSKSCNDVNSSYGSMYGIAAFQDKVIGFSHQGFIVSISNVDGTACLIHDYSSKSIQFDGAGVTTSAPVTPPPPK